MDQQHSNHHHAVNLEPVVKLKNIHKTYLHGTEAHQALRGVSLEVYQNELVIIYGTSGGGKTSLLNIIGTIDMASRGELWVAGVKVQPKTQEKVLSRVRLDKIGFVFQTFNLLSSMTALENVELPMTLKSELSHGERRKKALSALQRVGLSHRINHYPNMLSGGEQQRVAIARATANDPQLLLLDEPTGDLDTVNSRRIIALLLHQKKMEGKTLIMVTHDTALKNIADRVVYMRDGRIARVETIDQTLKMQSRSQYGSEFASGAYGVLGHENSLSTVIKKQDSVLPSLITAQSEIRSLANYSFCQTVKTLHNQNSGADTTREQPRKDHLSKLGKHPLSQMVTSSSNQSSLFSEESPTKTLIQNQSSLSAINA
ncbi:hypothetical protein MP228_006266 [Amoeboaphelidium protococcarum]|nr:hypothetical protein MP228_006266 [Amoeboaphelidium protococcarum]